MDNQGPPRRSGVRHWLKDKKGEVKDAFKKLFRSTPPSGAPTAAPHHDPSGEGAEGFRSPNEGLEPAQYDTLQVPVAAGSHLITLQGRSPDIQGTATLLEDAPITTYTANAANVSLEHPSGDHLQTGTSATNPSLSQTYSEASPIPQEPSPDGQPEAPIGSSGGTPGNIHSTITTQQVPHIVTPGDFRPQSDSALVNNAADTMGTPIAALDEQNMGSSTWYTGIRATLTLVERGADVFPPLKSVVSGINGFLDIYDAFKDNKQEFDKLAQRVRLVDAILGSCPADTSQEFKDRRDGLERYVGQ